MPSVLFVMHDEVTPVLHTILKGTKDTQEALQHLGRQSEKTEKLFNQLSLGMEESKARVSSARSEYNKLIKEVDKTNKAHDNAVKALEKLKRETKDSEKETEEYAKALGEAEQAVEDLATKQKELETSLSGARSKLNDRIADQQQIQKEYKQTTKLMQEQTDAYNLLTSAASRGDNRIRVLGKGSGGSSGMLSALGKSGALYAAGQLASQMAGTLGGMWMSNTMDGTTANYWNKTLSGMFSTAGMGASIGNTILPGIGGAIGGVAGGVLGGLTGWLEALAQEEEDKNNAYKTLRNQAVEDAYSQSEDKDTQGISIASGREMVKASYRNLLKDEDEAASLYAGVKKEAISSAYTFDDLSGVATSLSVTYKDSATILERLDTLVDAGATIGASSDDLMMMSRGLMKIKNSGYATREELDLLSDRGIPIYEMIQKKLGIDGAELSRAIREQKVSWNVMDELMSDKTDGAYTVANEYAGGADKQKDTYTGKLNTLEGMKQEYTDAAYGEAYNEELKPYLDEQIKWYEENGEKIQKIYQARGQANARLAGQQMQAEISAMEGAISQFGSMVGDLDTFDPFQTQEEWFAQMNEGAGTLYTNLENIAGLMGQMGLPGTGIAGLGTSVIASGLASDAFNQNKTNIGEQALLVTQTLPIRTIGELAKTDYHEFMTELKKTVTDYSSALMQEHPELYQMQVELNIESDKGKDTKTKLAKQMGGLKTYIENQDYSATAHVKIIPSFRTVLSGEPKINVPVYGQADATYGKRKQEEETNTQNLGRGVLGLQGNAWGLNRVPYDNYPALLHAGERVLTAQEARRQERGNGGVQVTITGNTFSSGNPQDIAEQVGEIVVRKLVAASKIMA